MPSAAFSSRINCPSFVLIAGESLGETFGVTSVEVLVVVASLYSRCVGGNRARGRAAEATNRSAGAVLWKDMMWKLNGRLQLYVRRYGIAGVEVGDAKHSLAPFCG